MTDEHASDVRIDVTGDRKPGRWVRVGRDRAVLGYSSDRPEILPWSVTLSIDSDNLDGKADTWTGLTPAEARAVGRALIAAADAAETDNAADPRG